MQRKLIALFILALLLFQAAGCSDDPLVRHKQQTAFFDGVPDLPPLAQLCTDNMEDIFNVFYQERLAEAMAASIEEDKVIDTGSSHRPFTEKNCEGCHDFQKANMLLVPDDELCESCHVGFVKGDFVHGPVAIRDCMACHLPHSSKHRSLLQENVSAICEKCHQEERLAAQMHDAVMEHNMDCVDCHDAHYGSREYFLK